jgi:hypothetical protein
MINLATSEHENLPSANSAEGLTAPNVAERASDASIRERCQPS